MISRRIHERQYHYHKSNNIIDNCNANNQLRRFSSTIGYGAHHGGRGRGNDRGRGHQSTKRIPMVKDCRTLDDAIEVCYDNLETLTPRNLSAFWSAVPRLLRYQERGVHLVPQLEAIFLKTADQIHSYEPRDLVSTTLGFAKTIQALQRSKRRCGSSSYEGYFHGILIRQRDAVFSFLARTAVNKLDQIEPRHISNLAYAYALLEFVPILNDGSNLFDHIADKSIPKLEKFNPQDLSNIIWAFEKVKVPHPDLFKRIGDHIVLLDHLNDFAPQALANILIAYAKAEESHLDLFNKVADHIVSLEHLNDFKPQALSNTLNAYAKAELSHLELFSKAADHIVSLDNLDGYNEQNISTLVWSYNKAGIIRQDLNNKLIGVATDRKFSTKRLETLNRWASEECKNIEVAAQDVDAGGSVVAVEDENNENNVEEEDDDASVSEDLSLLTVVQLKDRLRHLGLSVSGRKHELIDRLNDYFKVQDGDE